VRKICALAAFFVLLTSFSAHAGSIVRIQCDDEDAGSEVFIDGRFVGECPVDAQVPSGTVVLRARKKLPDPDYEKVYEKQLRLGDGTAQRLELIMSEPRLTAEARARRESEKAAAILQQAEAGDIAAMGKIAQLYEAGGGVAKDPKAAARWHGRAEAAKAQAHLAAAKAGSMEAMESMAARYEKGLGVEKDPAQVEFWRNKALAAKRQKAAEDAEAARRRVAEQEEAARLRMAQEKRQEAELKAQNRQNRIDAVRFDKNTSHLVNSSGVKNNVTEILTTGIPTMLTGLVLDLISLPTRCTELQAAKSEASLRPSTWGNPDSMIAKAARSQVGSPAAAGARALLASR